MRVHNIWVDDDGETHFRDIEVAWGEQGPSGRYSERLAATGIIFRQVQPDYDLDWHPAPRRQYIINLDAGVEITVSDGETRVIGAGEVFLVEDEVIFNQNLGTANAETLDNMQRIAEEVMPHFVGRTATAQGAQAAE